MALFQWNPTLSVGIASFDAEHQKLVQMVNDLVDAMREGKGGKAVNEVLGRLAKYTSTHFVAEENLMKKEGYPGFEKHKKEHDKLIAQVADIEKKAAAGNALPASLLNFLKDWLINHILKEDKNYGPFLNRKGFK